MDLATLSSPHAPLAVLGRYAVYDEIASGGMATVHLGKLLGAGGFSRVVAIKRLHPQFVKDADFSTMFMDEARLAARLQHPNVVQTLDVVTIDGELLLVMEYVHGLSLAAALRASKKAGARVDPRVVVGVLVGALEGLHAAHEAKSPTGEHLGVVHRDVSPQNILVAAEGTARILDFGVAKAVGKMHATLEGQLKGKLAYMSPEQVRAQEVTRSSDLFSTGVVLWEALTGQRLFDAPNPAGTLMAVMTAEIPSPRLHAPELPPALEAVVLKSLARAPADRYPSARAMADALEEALAPATRREIARWMDQVAGETLAQRSELVAQVERAEAEGVALAEGAVSGPRPTARDATPSGKEESGPVARSRSGNRPPAPPPARAPLPAPAPPAVEVQDEARTLVQPKGPRGSMESLPPSSANAAVEPTLPSPKPASALRAPMSSGGPGASAKPLPSLMPPARARPVRYGGREGGSLRELLQSPLTLVGAGVLISLADPIARAHIGDVEVRPLWAAEALVIVGVFWAVFRLLMAARTPRD